MKQTQVWQDVDQDFFRNTIKPLARPAILKGLVGHWPAVAAGREKPEQLSSYLLQFYSGAPVLFFEGEPAAAGRIFYDETLSGMNFTQRRAPLSELLGRLVAHFDDAAPPTLYAGSLSVPAYVPGFARENSLLGMIPAATVLDKIWIGNRTVVPLHYDSTENIACVVAGRRRFTLFPIEQIKNLYIGPPDITPAGQTISLVDTRNPDLEKFPRYAEALEAGEIAELEPGDALYIPTLWWHGVESLTAFGVLVNYWWRDGPDYLASPAQSLLHCLLTIKDLPESQRQSWKAVFDYLIFQSEGPALAHLPPDHPSLFTALTPEKAARIKAFLRSALEH